MIDTIVDLYHGDDVPGEDWATIARGGVVAVIHKASEGLKHVDESYAMRRVKATHAVIPRVDAVGLGGCPIPAPPSAILWGAYHFATGADGSDQADHFLASAQPDNQTLMALDLETNPTGSTVTIQAARDFVTRVRQVTGRFPWVYGSNVVADFAGVRGDPVLSQCLLWIARYGGHTPVVPPGWKNWTLWQYLEGEAAEHADKLPGLGLVDRSRFDGTFDELKAIWVK